jgi:hypothetical protein
MLVCASHTRSTAACPIPRLRHDVLTDGNIHFRATLIALMNRLMGTDLPVHLEVVRGLQRQLTRAEGLARRPRAYASLRHTPSFNARHRKDGTTASVSAANAAIGTSPSQPVDTLRRGSASANSALPKGAEQTASVAPAPIAPGTGTGLLSPPTPAARGLTSYSSASANGSPGHGHATTAASPGGPILHQQGSNHDVTATSLAAPLPQRKRGSFAIRFYTPFEVTWQHIHSCQPLRQSWLCHP